MNIVNVITGKKAQADVTLTDKEKQWANTLSKGVVSVKDIIAPTGGPYLWLATQGMYRQTGCHP
jgi:hypothetical protein